MKLCLVVRLSRHRLGPSGYDRLMTKKCCQTTPKRHQLHSSTRRLLIVRLRIRFVVHHLLEVSGQRYIENRKIIVRGQPPQALLSCASGVANVLGLKGFHHPAPRPPPGTNGHAIWRPVSSGTGVNQNPNRAGGDKESMFVQTQTVQMVSYNTKAYESPEALLLPSFWVLEYLPETSRTGEGTLDTVD